MAIEIYKNNPYGESQNRVLLYSTAGTITYNIVPGILKKEINKPESFEFDIYPNVEVVDGIEKPVLESFLVGYHYISIEDTNKIGSTYENDGIMFYGRIIGIDYDMFGKRHITCEGLMANLLDFPMYMPSSESATNENEEIEKRLGIHNLYTADTEYLFQYAMTAYNEGTGRRDIIQGYVDSSNVYEKEYSEEDDRWFRFLYPWNNSVGDFIVSQLIGVYGGVLVMRYNKLYNGIQGTLDWNETPIIKNASSNGKQQPIVYGDNVLDASLEDITSDMVVGIFPVGIDKYNTKHWIQYRTNGHYAPWVNYGSNWSYCGINNVKAVDFDNARTTNQLRKQCDNYVKLYCSNRKFKVNVTCIDKHFINYDNSEDSSEYGPIDVGYLYLIDVPFMGQPVVEELLCLSCEIDIGDLKNSSYTFGDYIPPELLKSRYITG